MLFAIKLNHPFVTAFPKIKHLTKLTITAASPFSPTQNISKILLSKSNTESNLWNTVYTVKTSLSQTLSKFLTLPISRSIKLLCFIPISRIYLYYLLPSPLLFPLGLRCQIDKMQSLSYWPSHVRVGGHSLVLRSLPGLYINYSIIQKLQF